MCQPCAAHLSSCQKCSACACRKGRSASAGLTCRWPVLLLVALAVLSAGGAARPCERTRLSTSPLTMSTSCKQGASLSGDQGAHHGQHCS